MKTSVLKEPYRIFFPLAVVAGMTGVGLWYFYGTGRLSYYSGFLHACIQMQICMGCFIAGFLMTAIPRMSATQTATVFEVISQLVMTLAALAAYCLNHPALGHLFYVFWILLLARFLWIRFKNRQPRQAPLARPPVEFIWVPAGLLLSLTAAVCYLLSLHFKGIAYFAQQTVNQGLILCVTAGVGSFMGARLTGRMRTQKAQAAACTPEAMPNPRKRMFWLQAAGVLLFYLSFILEGFHRDKAAYVIRSAVITICFFVSGVLPKWPKVKDLYAWILWLSFWLVILGLWGCPIHLVYRKTSLHVSFVGGLGLMTYMVATMVTISHAGQAQLLRKPLLVLWICFFGVLTSLGFRVAAVLWTDYFFKFISIASLIWALTGALWLLMMVRYLFKVPNADAVHEQHEKIKQRVPES